MSTRAQQIRAAVLACAQDGLSEEEIAQCAGTTVERVRTILDREEAGPRPEPPVLTPSKPRSPRSQHRIHPGSTTVTGRGPYAPLDPADLSLELPPKRPRKVAEHGTESGYRKHRRAGEDPCPGCREAMRLRAQRRRIRDALAKRSQEQPAELLDNVGA